MDDSSLKNYRLQMTAVIDKSSLRDAPQIKKRENVGIFPKWGTPRTMHQIQDNFVHFFCLGSVFFVFAYEVYVY